LLTRVAASILLGVPTTLIPPLPLTRALTRRFRREEMLLRAHHMVGWAGLCRRHVLDIRLDLAGKENLPRPSRGHLYVCNHQSWLDIIVLMEALETAAFLAKDMVRWMPVLGSAAAAAGSVFVSRDDAESRRAALHDTIRMCRESVAVVVFPEGTRSPDGQVREEIRPGTVREAHAQRLRAVPVAVDGTHLVMPKAMDCYRAGLTVAVTVGAPMDPASYPDADSWTDAVWHQVKDLHAQGRARRLQGGHSPVPPQA
jgi:1-acyl-sn-glycerol-3-phosphate acyltransferase